MLVKTKERALVSSIITLYMGNSLRHRIIQGITLKQKVIDREKPAVVDHEDIDLLASFAIRAMYQWKIVGEQGVFNYVTKKIHRLFGFD
jgi:hypothetical protein